MSLRSRISTGHIGEERARQRDALPFRARQALRRARPPACHSLSASRRMKSCAFAQPRRCSTAAMLAPGPPIGDVFGQRPVKQDRVLLHDRDLAAQRIAASPQRYPGRRSGCARQRHRRAAAPVLRTWSCRSRSGRPGRRAHRRGCPPTDRHTAAPGGRRNGRSPDRTRCVRPGCRSVSSRARRQCQ